MNDTYDKGKSHGIILGFITTTLLFASLAVFFTIVILPFISGEGYYRGWTESVQERNLPSVGEINNMAQICNQLK